VGMVARYHHVQILEVIDDGFWADEYECLFYVKLSEPVLSGSLNQDYLMVHARDELDAWKKTREYLDGKRG
jgi:hypothetical protein